MAEVAPRAGAWIEMWLPAYLALLITVAPRAGAWIEITAPLPKKQGREVAPRAGAWIEMDLTELSIFSKQGRAPRGRVD